MLYEGIDNMIWSGSETENIRWCERNKVFDEITEADIEEIWMREAPDQGEPIRLNEKYVWETAKRVCEYINAPALDNENKMQWIGIPTKETQAQAEVLRQHHLGQQVLAEVIKRMADPWQQPQPQPQHQRITAGNGPTVTVVDEDDGTRLDFMGGPSPHPTPPDIGSMRMEIEPQQTP